MASHPSCPYNGWYPQSESRPGDVVTGHDEEGVNLCISIAKHAPVIDIGTAHDDDPIVNNQKLSQTSERQSQGRSSHLVMNIDLIHDQLPTQVSPVA
jgi:hypothetical protein